MANKQFSLNVDKEGSLIRLRTSTSSLFLNFTPISQLEISTLWGPKQLVGPENLTSKLQLNVPLVFQPGADCRRCRLLILNKSYCFYNSIIYVSLD